jgi:superfamily I DNA/RNA helicase
LVDEAQDLAPVNHKMLEKLKGSRIIAVGDAFQSIYQFRGACENGMDRLATAFEMTEHRLSLSFRCPERIVENVKWRAQWFRASAPGGHVDSLSTLSLLDFADGAAIICRNNAPLFKLAFDLISSGRSVRVAGSDIGPKLVRVLRKLGDENMGRSAVLGAITEWEAAKVEKGSTTAADMAAAMRVFAGHAANLAQAIAHAEWLFKQDGTLSLLTGHKAKGLEFNTVYHLDRSLERASEQDQNLTYVIDTRPRESLFYINSGDIAK